MKLSAVLLAGVFTASVTLQAAVAQPAHKGKWEPFPAGSWKNSCYNGDYTDAAYKGFKATCPTGRPGYVIVSHIDVSKCKVRKLKNSSGNLECED